MVYCSHWGHSQGKDDVEKFARNHWAASPDRIKNLMNLFASEDSACLEYLTGGTLTKQADFPSIKILPTGKKYEFMCCFVFHITNGKIDRVHEYFDMKTVKRQLSKSWTVQIPACTDSFSYNAHNNKQWIFG